jgi:lysophospholipid hydrolase
MQSPLTIMNPANTMVSVASSAPGTPGASVPAGAAQASTFGLLGRVILTIMRVIPGVLYWVITFSTITLPTWLFTLFSTTLTFTMNFTTL